MRNPSNRCTVLKGIDVHHHRPSDRRNDARMAALLAAFRKGDRAEMEAVRLIACRVVFLYCLIAVFRNDTFDRLLVSIALMHGFTWWWCVRFTCTVLSCACSLVVLRLWIMHGFIGGGTGGSSRRGHTPR